MPEQFCLQIYYFFLTYASIMAFFCLSIKKSACAYRRNVWRIKSFLVINIRSWVAEKIIHINKVYPFVIHVRGFQHTGNDYTAKTIR